MLCFTFRWYHRGFVDDLAVFVVLIVVITDDRVTAFFKMIPNRPFGMHYYETRAVKRFIKITTANIEIGVRANNAIG